MRELTVLRPILWWSPKECHWVKKLWSVPCEKCKRKLLVSGNFSIYSNGCVYFSDMAFPSYRPFPHTIPFLGLVRYISLLDEPWLLTPSQFPPFSLPFISTSYFVSGCPKNTLAHFLLSLSPFPPHNGCTGIHYPFNPCSHHRVGTGELWQGTGYSGYCRTPE